MPILTNSGRVVIAESITARGIHLAWGSGDSGWVTLPPEDVNATALLNEVGRRVATEVAYVVPDESGDIVLPNGSFARSVDPTKYLYVRTTFDFLDASSAVIREIGVFVGTETDPLLPPGQQYFEQGDILDPGRLLHIEHLGPIYRSQAIRESFETVIAF